MIIIMGSSHPRHHPLLGLRVPSHTRRGSCPSGCLSCGCALAKPSRHFINFSAHPKFAASAALPACGLAATGSPSPTGSSARSASWQSSSSASAVPLAASSAASARPVPPSAGQSISFPPESPGSCPWLFQSGKAPSTCCSPATPESGWPSTAPYPCQGFSLHSSQVSSVPCSRRFWSGSFSQAFWSAHWSTPTVVVAAGDMEAS